MARISFIIGYGASMLPLFSKVLKEEAREHGFDGLAISDVMCERYEDFIASSDAVFLYTHELPSDIEDLLKNSDRMVISVTDNYAHLTRASMELAEKASKLFKVGGEENFRNLVHLLLKSLGHDVEVGEVVEVPWHGIYHPRLGTFDSTPSYLKRYRYKDRPLVGIIFHRTYWLYNDLAHINILIEKLEEEELGVLPIFTYGSFKDRSLGNVSTEDSIREFFLMDGETAVDAIVNLTFFFLLDHGKWHEREQKFEEAKGMDLLRKLNVPIIQPIFSFYRSVKEWIEDPKGADYLTQVYTIIMPEVDGLIEPIFIAGSRPDSQGVKTWEAYEEHAKYIARRVKKWIELRRKKPSERRVAIVLINPPCKGLEASVAVGYGLDVPESIVHLLRRLRELGYEVGNELPSSGKDLIEMIMNKKAISEFRWTSVDEIVEKGGAIAFIDEDRYLKWFGELPKEVREKMIKDWGEPSNVLAGNVEKELVGMVYKGKFVVPGLLFGNVFITPQPKFGCVGPACDGKVCRILHDPTITPPHQWFAVYRWITRVFKADLVIHFGTHGYLEFRPGKGVGLCPSCWPEISIDDTPHLYVYVVSNPMEGVIAKRRSYATIVDHLCPPMAMADVLDKVEFLLTQYSRAKQLGEFERAKVIYEDLVKEAKDNNIPVKEKDPDKVVEEIHRYVDMVRGTQIQMGLHVFARPPRESGRLAEYVATVMAYDSHSFPSIRRVLARYLGLDYDELKAKPQELNKFGVTNSQMLGILHKLAVYTIGKALELGFSSSNLPGDSLIKIIDEEFERHFEVKRNVGG